MAARVRVPGNGWFVAVRRGGDYSSVFIGTEDECQRMADAWLREAEHDRARKVGGREGPEEIAVAMIHDWPLGARL